ncbi:glycoside hydrolase 45 [Auriculariales sp. MPI-PUGE-AT-0066]|nr:glycoside hydrolase 45 [Auriculariales sp. MPI-PUGE-AT-0066]
MAFKLAQSVALAFALINAASAQSGSGHTTRYWDCCKTSCGWSGKADVKQPVQSCNAAGSKLTDFNAQSGCNGGGAFACTDNAPWAINDSLAYGFAARPVSGQKMIIQATNTGGDLGNNHFDLMMPGGGVGIFNGCASQFGSWNGGAQYGGIGSRSECDNLPAAVRAGCYFRFDWFKGADNPDVTFKKTTCPSELVSKSGCMRNDASGLTTVTSTVKSSTSTSSTIKATSTSTTTKTTTATSTTATGTVTKTVSVTLTSTVPASTKTVTATVTNGGATATKTVTVTSTAACATSSATKSSSSSAQAAQPTNTAAAAARWAQCGGKGFSGPTSCVTPYKCSLVNDYYSQCL